MEFPLKCISYRLLAFPPIRHIYPINYIYYIAPSPAKRIAPSPAKTHRSPSSYISSLLKKS